MGRRAKPSREDSPYVGKGGLKLEFALDHFGISVQNAVVADYGSHLGGFTDCLLQRGAAKVYAVDTCYGTLAWVLRQNPKVVVCERTNALHWLCPEKLDFIAVDVGWTRQRHIIPAAIKNLRPEGSLLSLLKPQYEVDFHTSAKGVLTEDQVSGVTESIRPWLEERFDEIAAAASPYHGSGGNAEVWFYLARPSFNRGFTLLEILVAMMIFLVGSTSIFALWIAAIKIHKDALDEEQVSFLATSLMADYQGRKVHAPVSGAVDNRFPGLSYDMSFIALGQGAVLMKLTIACKRGGKTRSEIFYTVLRPAPDFP